MPKSGFSFIAVGLSSAELTNAEKSMLAPGIMERSIIVEMLIITNRGNRYAGRVFPVTRSLNDRHVRCLAFSSSSPLTDSSSCINGDI